MKILKKSKCPLANALLGLFIFAITHIDSTAATSTDPAVQAQADQLSNVKTVSGMLPAGKPSTVTANTGSLDHFADYDSASALHQIGGEIAKSALGNPAFSAALNAVPAGKIVPILLTNNQELPTLLYIGQDIESGFDALSGQLTREAANVQDMLSNAQKAPKQQKMQGKVLPLVPLALAALATTAIQSIGPMFKADYTIGNVSISTDYLQVYAGICDEFQKEGPNNQKIQVLINGIALPSAQSKLIAKITALQAAEDSLNNAIQSAQAWLSSQQTKPADLAAEVTAASTLVKTSDAFVDAITGASTPTSASKFAQVSQALALADALGGPQSFALMIHIPVLGGSTVTEGETVLHNPRVTYQYSVRAEGFLVTSDRIIALPAPPGIQESKPVSLPWH